MLKHGKLLWFVTSLVLLAVPVICITRASQAMSALKSSNAVSHLSVNVLAVLTTQYLLVLYLGYLIGVLAALSLLLCVISAVRSMLLKPTATASTVQSCESSEPGCSGGCR